MTRALSMSDAIAEATCMAMRRDPAIFVMGVGVDDPSGIFGTTRGPHDEFGDARVFDTPLSENCLTGMAVGAALTGMRPVLVHARVDFLLLTLDQLVNHAAKWSYMSAGALHVPMLVRAVVGRGWGQAAQHSQSLQAVIASFPGVEVIMPSTPHDAKGLLLSALTGSSPVVCIEHRWNHGVTGPVAEDWFTVPIGSARTARDGSDVTIVAVSQMVAEAERAATLLAAEGTSCEVLDLRSIRPWDREAVCSSVRRTGRLVVADTGWVHFGLGPEIAATVGARLFGQLKSPIELVGLPDVPTPCAPNLEAAYYPNAANVVSAVRRTLGARRHEATVGEPSPDAKPFRGAF